jgi:hypothetical protein
MSDPNDIKVKTESAQKTPKRMIKHQTSERSVITKDQTLGGNVVVRKRIPDTEAIKSDTPVDNASSEDINHQSLKLNITNIDAVLDGQNENHTETETSPPQQRGMLKTALIIILLFLLVLHLYSTGTNDKKDTPEDLNFSTYYGIADMKNYFETEKADDCSSMIIFRPALPQMILKSDNSASSFMALGKYGSGKTLLRCEYWKSLSSNNYVKIFISEEQITKYLNRFASSIGVNESYCQTQNCLNTWSANEFAQVLLSTLVTEFINTYDKRNFKDQDLVLDKKINLITIVCYYYNDEGTPKLEAFVNSFLGKGFGSKYKIENAEEQLRQENVKSDRQLLKHLQNDLEKFVILSQDFERLLLLMSVLRGEKFEGRARNKHVYGNTIQDLIEFSSFIRKSVKKTPVFVIDDIDENKLLVRNNEVNSAALESFCRSSISQSIIGAALTGNFYLSLFYPKVNNVNLENVIIPKDKFLTHIITWNRNSLINYADYVLEEMNKKASKKRCKPFPDFKTLVNYTNGKIAEIIDKILTPRELHLFMMELIIEMNGDANNVRIAFEATEENVRTAFTTASKSFRR